MSDARFPDGSTLTDAERKWATDHGMDLDRYAGMKAVRSAQDMAALDRHLTARADAADAVARQSEVEAQARKTVEEADQQRHLETLRIEAEIAHAEARLVALKNGGAA
jgi:hypothetical protein